jgi:hypothetical protein
MSNLAALTKRLLPALAEACTGYYGDDLVSLVIYGSVARGTATYQSDVDILLIVADLPSGRLNRMRGFTNIENTLSEEIETARKNGWMVDLSPIIRTPSEVNEDGYIYLDMVEDARILFDRNNFFAAFLKSYKNKLEAYGAKKRPWKGGYYWEIKPDIQPGEVLDL